MVLERFTIFLDNVDATYFPGQQITGKVHVWNNLPKNVRGIYVECRGFARVSFSTIEQRSRTIRRRGRSHLEVTDASVNHTSNEEYFYQRIALKEGGNDHWEMNQGRHQYPFSFTLPNEIPSSFEGIHGYVRYTIRAVFQRRRKWNHECKIAFTVNSIMDLNTIAEASMPVEACDYKTLGLFCCQSNPITARFSLDRMGYVPGEKIYFNAEVENLSRQVMHGSKFQLIERTRFHAMGKTESYERVIREFSRGQFATSEFWENHPISVPPVVSSELRCCKIIDVDYRIVFTVDPGTFSFNLSISHGVIIGNVPLRSSFPDFQRNRRQLNAAAANVSMLENNDNNPIVANPAGIDTVTDNYPDLPPPTYEECMFGGNIRDAEDSEHVNYGAGMSYNPRYLTYGQIFS